MGAILHGRITWRTAYEVAASIALAGQFQARSRGHYLGQGAPMSASGSSKHTTRRQQEAHSLDLVQRVIISFLIGLFLAPSPPCLPPTWQSVVIKIFRSSGLRGYEGSSAVGFCDGWFRLVSGGGEVWVLLGWVVGALCTAAVD